MAGLRQIIDDGSLPLRMDEHPRKRLNVLQARVEIPNLDMLTRIEAGGPGSGRHPEAGSKNYFKSDVAQREVLKVDRTKVEQRDAEEAAESAKTESDHDNAMRYHMGMANRLASSGNSEGQRLHEQAMDAHRRAASGHENGVSNADKLSQTARNASRRAHAV